MFFLFVFYPHIYLIKHKWLWHLCLSLWQQICHDWQSGTLEVESPFLKTIEGNSVSANVHHVYQLLADLYGDMYMSYKQFVGWSWGEWWPSG